MLVGLALLIALAAVRPDRPAPAAEPRRTGRRLRPDRHGRGLRRRRPRPITAVIILFELTGEYTIIPPLMAAIALATGTSRLLTGETIYTAKLRRRGVDIDTPAPGTPAAALTVRDAMEPLPAHSRRRPPRPSR